jgi:sugar O-acyltransferase (sialic acid O-acetyltransferase NeuD family)
LGKKKIVLVGGGGHAKVVYATLARLKTFDVVGYTDTEERDFFDLRYLGDDDKLPEIFKYAQHAAVTVGQMKSHDLRRALYDTLKGIGFYLPPIVALSAVVMEGAEIGEGSYIGEQAYLGPGVSVGIMSIVNTGAVVEHGSVIGDFVHVSIHATLAGDTRVGTGSLVGMAAAVSNGVTIGDRVIAAAGAVVRKNVEDRALVFGNPARIRKNFNK